MVSETNSPRGKSVKSHLYKILKNGGDRYVYYLDCGDCFQGLCQYLSNCIHQIHAVYCISIIPT